MNNLELARTIDHTLLKPDATRAHIERLCAEARQHHFYAVCVNLCWARLCADLLDQSGVKLCAVVGFPFGATTTLAKMFEAGQALDVGVDEVDMVINVGALKSGLADFARQDIAGVVSACHPRKRWFQRRKRPDALLKVIIECGFLTDDEKRQACQLAVEAGADFVKTSTGINSTGATVADVRLMRAVVGPNVVVKAAGGVRSRADALAMIEAGANRIGSSNGVAIVTSPE